MFKENLDLVGTLYDQEDSAYNLYKIIKDKKIRNMYLKIGGAGDLVLKKSESVIGPEFAVNIKFDFTKSSSYTNDIFLKDFLIYTLYIQKLSEKSVLTNDMMNYIWSSELYNDTTRTILLTKQNIFINDDLIKSLSDEDLLIALTQNNHRNKDNLSLFESDMIRILKSLVANNLENEEAYLIWEDLLRATLSYFDNIDISALKNDIIQEINYAIENLNLWTFDVRLQKRALEHLSPNMDSKEFERKQSILDMLNSEEERFVEEKEELEKKIRNIKGFLA